MSEPSPGTDQVELRIEQIDPSAESDRTDQVVEAVTDLFHRALPVELRDDRFDGWRPDPELIGAIGSIDGTPVAYVGGGVSRGRIQLDSITDQDDGASVIEAMVRSLEQALAAVEAETLELWGRPARDWHPEAAARLGLTELRALHQLRCSLPVEDRPLPDRPFRPGFDEEALLRVNNRAFSHHPDQGAMTTGDLAAVIDRPGFDPDAIRLYDDPDGRGLAGFCWTKIHEPLGPGQPGLGEIYAIGVDPDQHGKGLGRPMTASGLHWLASQGLTTGMLYVEADNEPALRTYAKLGFDHHRTDRAWHRDHG